MAGRRPHSRTQFLRSGEQHLGHNFVAEDYSVVRGLLRKVPWAPKLMFYTVAVIASRADGIAPPTRYNLDPLNPATTDTLVAYCAHGWIVKKTAPKRKVELRRTTRFSTMLVGHEIAVFRCVDCALHDFTQVHVSMRRASALHASSCKYASFTIA